VPIAEMMEKAVQLSAGCPSGCIVEFGVYRGDALLAFRDLAKKYLPPNTEIYGFDSFAGMPKTAVPLTRALTRDWAEGAFGDTNLKTVRRRVPSARLVKGVFSWHSSLLAFGIEKVRLAHVDADIYEGYRDALRLLTPCVQLGSVLLFDEGQCPDNPEYISVRDHGERAIREWQNSTGIKLEVIESQWTQVLTQIVA
jgi:Macrocin-O-methyltransferase (TylF)